MLVEKREFCAKLWTKKYKKERKNTDKIFLPHASPAARDFSLPFWLTQHPFVDAFGIVRMLEWNDTIFNPPKILSRLSQRKEIFFSSRRSFVDFWCLFVGKKLVFTIKGVKSHPVLKLINLERFSINLIFQNSNQFRIKITQICSTNRPNFEWKKSFNCRVEKVFFRVKILQNSYRVVTWKTTPEC